jgi:hypothetical protein
MDREEQAVRFLELLTPIEAGAADGINPPRIVDDHVICLVGDEPRAALEDLLKTCATPVAKRGAEHSPYFRA